MLLGGLEFLPPPKRWRKLLGGPDPPPGPAVTPDVYPPRRTIPYCSKPATHTDSRHPARLHSCPALWW